ncbi:hypothetical protein DOTSEDRAFT_67852 [Dothistroma septosporum NZE10]|uniref:Uncharacterized protein n=1 Tax=Dothistroma septosporum (strain NZE10 / CBS 128990) TaxID=675120 RepID=N1Q392_DOTSN|nr:hypothetical protein DOTSEDRAFT_67852 [Dothistroma septosporum NZE10]
MRRRSLAGREVWLPSRSVGLSLTPRDMYIGILQDFRAQGNLLDGTSKMAHAALPLECLGRAAWHTQEFREFQCQSSGRSMKCWLLRIITTLAKCRGHLLDAWTSVNV